MNPRNECHLAAAPLAHTLNVFHTYVQVATQGIPSQQVSVVEGQLTWMIYIVGAVIKGRLISSSAESQVWGNEEGGERARIMSLHLESCVTLVRSLW